MKKQIVLLALVAVTVLIYLPTLDNGLTNWDDPKYLINNEVVHQLSFSNLKNIFSIPSHGKYNYHPLTLLSYALEYHFFQLDPRIYHLNNLLLHGLNVVLVYILILLVFESTLCALLASFMFAVHPINTEAVAWVTARKDLLYSFFFLGGLIFYVQYVKRGQMRNWGGA